MIRVMLLDCGIDDIKEFLDAAIDKFTATARRVAVGQKRLQLALDGAGRASRPGWRWTDLDRAARRIRTGCLEPVRRRLGQPRPRTATLRTAGAAKPRLGLRPAPDRGGGRAGVLRGDDQRDLQPVTSGPWAPVSDVHDHRAHVRRAPQALDR